MLLLFLLLLHLVVINHGGGGEFRHCEWDSSRRQEKRCCIYTCCTTSLTRASFFFFLFFLSFAAETFQTTRVATKAFFLAQCPTGLARIKQIAGAYNAASIIGSLEDDSLSLFNTDCTQSCVLPAENHIPAVPSSHIHGPERTSDSRLMPPGCLHSHSQYQHFSSCRRIPSPPIR